MGGNIEFDSETGQGSCFRVSLPFGVAADCQAPYAEAPLRGRTYPDRRGQPGPRGNAPPAAVGDGCGVQFRRHSRRSHRALPVRRPGVRFRAARNAPRRTADPYELARRIRSCPAASGARLVALATPGALDHRHPGASLFSGSIVKPVRRARLVECLIGRGAAASPNGRVCVPNPGFREGLRCAGRGRQCGEPSGDQAPPRTSRRRSYGSPRMERTLSARWKRNRRIWC